MKLLIVILYIVLNSQSVYSHEVDYKKPKGTVIFSVELVKPKANKTGVFYYYHQPERALSVIEKQIQEDVPEVEVVQEVLPNITAYQFNNGKIISHYSIGPYSSEMLINEIHGLSLVSFNVGEVMQEARKKGPKHGTDGRTIITLHGNRYKISYSFEGVEFNYVAMNPKFPIKKVAKYNQDIEKFNDLINLFALYYGLEAIGL